MAKKLTAKTALAVAQEYDSTRAQRLELDRQAAAVKEVELELRQQLMDMLQALDINSVGDNEKIYALVQKPEPTVEDWNALHAHIKKTGEFELLYRRVNPAAIKERWELHKQVPGVKQFIAITLSVTKAKGA